MIIKSLKQFDEEIERVIKAEHTNRSVILYRGHADSSWKITSSLERIGVEEISCKEYYQYIDSLKPLINPLIINKFIRKMTLAGYPFKFDNYGPGSWSLPEMEYLTYLRHHGFPTPTIDFTESHYIALFFACENFVNSKTNGKVFIYIDRKNAGKVMGNDIPDLRRIGRYVETDKRHFAQQSQYLIPVIFEKEWKLISFKRVIDDNKSKYNFYEIEIANEAKRAIVKDLRRMNINRFTMYLDEDSLIRNFADEFSLEKGIFGRTGGVMQK
ncbi:MAG: FRG domain-containing protein [Planctomycetes bacterium]|nr:FRG domain-containing protein [Planctomycetota bacterium]